MVVEEVVGPKIKVKGTDFILEQFTRAESKVN